MTEVTTELPLSSGHWQGGKITVQEEIELNLQDADVRCYELWKERMEAQAEITLCYYEEVCK